MSSIRDFASQLGFSDLQSRLDVLKLAEARLSLRLEFVVIRATLQTKDVAFVANVGVICHLKKRLSEASSGVEELRAV